MVVSASMVARELRRRRVGRASMIDSLAATDRSTWVPGDLREVPTALLVLAALSLTRPPAPGG